MEKIDSLLKIKELAKSRKAVVCPKQPGFIKPKPAAFVMSMTGHCIAGLLAKGLYIYEPKTGGANVKPISNNRPNPAPSNE